MGVFTRAGATILVLGISSHLAGWQLGWSELMVCSAACLVALVGASTFVIGRHRLVVERTLSSDRATVGDLVTSRLTITNPTRMAIGALQIETCAGEPPFDISGLAPGASTMVESVIPTTRRGVIDVGPTVIAKSDPLGLMRRDVQQTPADQLWVRPRSVAVNAVPVGFAKDLEGPTSDASPAGDVSFHALREYVVGDDHRHVHWMSTARTGTLMIRQYVDNRRPAMCVVLDTAMADSADFELAVEVSASLMVAGRDDHRSVTLRHTGRRPEHADPLDELTIVEPGTVSLLDAVQSALVTEPDISVCTIVTGTQPADTLLEVIATARRSAHVIVLRCGQRGVGDPTAIPGATSIEVDHLDALAPAWNACTR